MKFSAQEEYGLRCIMAIAKEGESGSLTIPEIARCEGLTQPHAAKLLAALRKAGYISSTRGQSGGYRLAKKPEEIVLGDLLSALGGRLVANQFCERFHGKHQQCAHKGQCDLRPLWDRIQVAVDSVVYAFTLRDLIDGSVARQSETLPVAPAAQAARRRLTLKAQQEA